MLRNKTEELRDPSRISERLIESSYPQINCSALILLRETLIRLYAKAIEQIDITSRESLWHKPAALTNSEFVTFLCYVCVH